MKYNNIEWVWIDLDDTLWDFRNNSVIALGDLYVSNNLARWFSSSDKWIDSYQACNHGLWERYNRAEITKEYLQTERFRFPLVAAGCDEPTAIEMSSSLDVEYLERLGRMSGLVPGARELIDHLHESGYKIGVLSNGFTEVQYSKLRSSGIAESIDLVVLSDDIGVNKPDRRLFDYAAKMAHTVAERCVMVGDNPATDIEGAAGAGWHTIYFNRDSAQADKLPANAVMVTDLHSVADLLCF